MNKHKNFQEIDENYNHVVTIALIFLLIIVRLSICKYERQNVIIAWVNFFSLFYVLWRIHFQINKKLKCRDRSVILKNQFKRFQHCSLIIVFLLFITMIVYSIIIYSCENIYNISGCINDIMSLFALLCSIEDEKIIRKVFDYYRSH